MTSTDAIVPDPRGDSFWSLGDAVRGAPLEGTHQADACVVGLGGSGLSCVRELLRLGASVIGIDAGSVGGGAAGRNGGFLLAGLAPFYHEAVARFGRARASQLYRLTLEELDRIVAETPEGIRRTGSLRVAESEEELVDCDAQLAALQADCFDVERYAGDEGEGLLIPGDGTFQPQLRCRALADAARSGGAALHEWSPVESLEPGVVRTTHGTVNCRFAIVAVDGGLEVILPELASRVRTARLQMLATAPEREVHFPRPVYARWGYDYWQQRDDGCITLGGARDLDLAHEWTTEARPTPVIQSALEERLRDRLHVTAPVTHRWAASVSYTANGLPVVEEVRDRVWAIGAYSGTGNVIGSLLGRGLARRLLSGDESLTKPFVHHD